MQKLLTKLLCAFFALCAFSQDVTASSESETVTYSFKAGAGRPGEAHRNGRQAHVTEYTVPVVTARQVQELDLSSFLEVSHENGVAHYLFAVKRPNGTRSSNVFGEHVQFAVMPEIGSDLRMSTKASAFKTATDILNGFFSADSLSSILEEENIVMHLFVPDERLNDVGAVLHIPGSKGARVSELAKGEAYARAGVPCLIPDIVGSEMKASTVDNQLQESMLFNALVVQIGHRLLSKMNGVNTKKIVWHGESIGTAQILAALMPEVLGVFKEAFISPSFIKLNDFATTLVTSGFSESPFWRIATLISGGQKDNFTPLEQVYAFLKIFNPNGESDPLKEVVENTQGHDAGCYTIDNVKQEEGSYPIKRALNYVGLWASMTGSMSKLRSDVRALGDSANIETLMPLLGAYMAEKLKLHHVGLEIMRQNLLEYQRNFLRYQPLDYQERNVDDQIGTKIAYFVGAIKQFVPGYTINNVVPEGDYEFEPPKVLGLLRCFPAGAEFGAETQEDAENLIAETMEHVLYHAGAGPKPSASGEADLDWGVLCCKAN